MRCIYSRTSVNIAHNGLRIAFVFVYLLKIQQLSPRDGEKQEKRDGPLFPSLRCLLGLWLDFLFLHYNTASSDGRPSR